MGFRDNREIPAKKHIDIQFHFVPVMMSRNEIEPKKLSTEETKSELPTRELAIKPLKWIIKDAQFIDEDN